MDKIPKEIKEHVEIKGIYDQVVKYRDAISHRYYAYTPLFETEQVTQEVKKANVPQRPLKQPKQLQILYGANEYEQDYQYQRKQD